MDIRIANNWCWGFWHEMWNGPYYEGDTLPCVENPGNWNSNHADVELPAGDWSGNHKYYYDTDAVRFYRGCVTRYHFWGTSTATVDRRGKSSLWRKISDLDHIYIDSISC